MLIRVLIIRPLIICLLIYLFQSQNVFKRMTYCQPPPFTFCPPILRPWKQHGRANIYLSIPVLHRFFDHNLLWCLSKVAINMAKIIEEIFTFFFWLNFVSHEFYRALKRDFKMISSVQRFQAVTQI